MKIIIEKQKAIQELERISARTSTEQKNSINRIVEEILKEVKNHGDLAVQKYTKKFDGFTPEPMQVSSKDLKEAFSK